MKKKLISVITPCFNENDAVIGCYEAIKNITSIRSKIKNEEGFIQL